MTHRAPDHCGIGMPDGTDCPAPADVKLADGSGASAWGCLAHADEVLVTARGVFIASTEPDGLESFLAARGRTPDGCAKSPAEGPPERDH